MSRRNPRNRVVVFRLSEDEYRTLKAACFAAGSRNLSDYTRSELLLALRSDAAEIATERRLRRFLEIDHKLQDLIDLLKEVFEYLHMESDAQVPNNAFCVEQQS